MHQSLIEFLYLFRSIPRAVSFYQGSPSLTVQRVFGIWRREGIDGVRRRANILLGRRRADSRAHLHAMDLYGEVPATSSEFNPKVSIIVPNYNHSAYLRQRLETIYQQTYANIEVILLDDCSSDTSIEILKEFAQRFSDRTTCKFNNTNTGSVFRQWKNGLEMATGELIWIAESDDFCTENFLMEQVRAFQNSAVMLSFCKTEFVAGEPPEKVWTLEEYLSDLGMADWGRSFLRSAHSLVCAGWAVKNIVPNVSSALFRHPRDSPILHDPCWLGLRLCGDWVFYLSIIRGGLVAYTPTATNYYRQHKRSTSQTVQRENLYYAEHEIVASYLVNFFRLDRNIIDKQDAALYDHWCYQRGSLGRAEFRSLYDPERVWARSIDRRLNVVMAVYALIAGGGETFPVILANLLHKRGYAVTLLNCLECPTEPGVLKMLDPLIPRLELSRLDLAGVVFDDMGIDLVHSHHAWVDLTLANLLIAHTDIKQVVTTHGMYETLPSSQLNALIPLLSLRIDHFVFTADKNIAVFPAEFVRLKRFSRISNALPSVPIYPVDRSSLNVRQEDFVLCMVARAIPEKGWAEAIEAVNFANTCSARRVHLLLIGDGVEFDRLCDYECPDYVHFLGFRENIRDYFAMCDMGFLPSRFKGESAPLVVIDCLLSGRPVLASDIGEVRRMLDSKDGLAGELFELRDWKLDTQKIGQAIADLANQPLRYDVLCARVASAALKFSTSGMVDSYEDVYRETVHSSLPTTKKS